MKIRAYLNQVKKFFGNHMESNIVPVSGKWTSFLLFKDFTHDLYLNNLIISIIEALKNLESVRDVLVSGGVIAVPTDTIYGLACLARNTAGLNKIYAIKGRSMTKPLG